MTKNILLPIFYRTYMLGLWLLRPLLRTGDKKYLIAFFTEDIFDMSQHTSTAVHIKIDDA